GSPTILFPPGVKRQFVRVWNDAEQERLFETEAPSGYHLLTSFGVAVDQRSPAVGAGNTLELVVEPAGAPPDDGADREWRPGEYGQTVSLERLKRARPEPGPHVVVAIDFGTRNTSVRVRWR